LRQLKVVFRTAHGALPLLVAAMVADTASCGDEGSGTSSAEHGDASRDDSGAAGNFTLGVGGSLVGTAGSNVISSDAACGGFYTSYLVELPPEGVPASPGQICAATVEPVESSRSARVTLSMPSADFRSATGRIEMAPGLLPLVVGLPTVEVVDGTAVQRTMQVTMMAREQDGFSFHASWSDPVLFEGRMTVRTTFQLSCVDDAGSPEAGVTREVHAATDIYICDGESGYERMWVSSGDRCIVCSVVAEMAPSPIVPDQHADDLPLARVTRLRIVELARVSNTVILLAENDGGSGLEYEWHPSDGHLERLANDVVAWTVQQGMAAPHIQAAIFGSSTAAVASWGFNEAS
jgi:hypothetical protein